MTELEHIEIEGFKGLENIEFEPTDINLITGKNNTGKTSFLEGIDLLFNPEKLEQFEGNVDKTINVNYDEFSINGETSKDGFEIVLKEPSDEEVSQYFVQSIIKLMETPSSLFHSLSGEGSTEIAEFFESLPPSALEKKLTTEKFQDVKSEFLILSTKEGKFPYFSPGQKTSEIMPIIYEEIENRFSDEFSPNGKEISDDVQSFLDGFGEADQDYSKTISSLVERVVESTNGGFLSQPNNNEVSKFIDSIDLTEGIEKPDEEGIAIKIDDIGDYLTEKGFVDNLKTFTLDYLVFEEDGEKHQIPYEFMGDGFKSTVGLLWELMDDDVENDIILLEEPETHMHPGYIREVVYFLIDLAREEDIQLFITTHDSDFINDFFTENLTDEEESYLEDEFSLLRMEEDSAVVEDYETARENLKDLHLDLRGI